MQDALDASRFAKVDPDQRITVQQSRLITDCAEIHQADTTAVEEKIAPDPAPRVRHAGPADVTGAPQRLLRGRAASGLPTARAASEHQEFSVGCHSSALIEREGPPVHALPGTVRTALRRGWRASLIRQIHAVADGLLMGEAVPSGRYSVIFSTHCFASLFGCFQSALSGKVGPAGDQPLARQAGPKRGFAGFTLESRAYMPGHEDQAFDGEGAATSDLLLIGEGSSRPCCTTAPPPATSA